MSEDPYNFDRPNLYTDPSRYGQQQLKAETFPDQHGSQGSRLQGRYDPAVSYCPTYVMPPSLTRRTALDAEFHICDGRRTGYGHTQKPSQRWAHNSASRGGIKKPDQSRDTRRTVRFSMDIAPVEHQHDESNACQSCVASGDNCTHVTSQKELEMEVQNTAQICDSQSQQSSGEVNTGGDYYLNPRKIRVNTGGDDDYETEPSPVNQYSRNPYDDSNKPPTESERPVGDQYSSRSYLSHVAHGEDPKDHIDSPGSDTPQALVGYGMGDF